MHLSIKTSWAQGKDAMHAVVSTAPSVSAAAELAPLRGQTVPDLQVLGSKEALAKNSLASKRGAGVWGNALNTKLAWVKALGDLGWYYDWWHAEPNAAVAAAANQKGMEFVPMLVSHCPVSRELTYARETQRKRNRQGCPLPFWGVWGWDVKLCNCVLGASPTDTDVCVFQGQLLPKAFDGHVAECDHSVAQSQGKSSAAIL
jgi:hypothetical protein